jgi:hypothetical protein
LTITQEAYKSLLRREEPLIPKGNQRGGGRQLATHLLNQFDNDRVELVDLRGAVAGDLHGAFHEWYAQSKATKCEKYLFSLSINPDLAKYDLSREQYLDFVERTERSFKLVGQPRAIVFHVKNGREHGHVVWSRIDIEAGKAVHMAKDRMVLRRVAQEFARDHGLTLPPGMRENSRRDRFNKRAKQSNHTEKQQQERSGISKEEQMAIITAVWRRHKDPHGFVQALERKGYQLARGGSGRYVVVDHAGEVHSLYRQIEDVKSAEVKAFLKDAYPLKELRDVETARAAALNSQKQQATAKEDEKGAHQKQAQTDDSAKREQEGIERREELSRKHQERRAELESRRTEMEKRMDGERHALLDLHTAEKDGVLADRAAKQPRGMVAFLSRITGIQAFIQARHARQDVAREKAHKAERAALDRRHGRERKDFNRQYANLSAVETRERQSLELALKRQEFQRAREISAGRATDLQVELKPEFNRAADPQAAARGETDSRAAKKEQLLRAFQAAADSRKKTTGDTLSFSKGDLQRAFEQAKDARRPVSSSGQQEHTEEIDAGKLESAEKAKEELQRRQEERDRKDRGPDWEK